MLLTRTSSIAASSLTSPVCLQSLAETGRRLVLDLAVIWLFRKLYRRVVAPRILLVPQPSDVRSQSESESDELNAPADFLRQLTGSSVVILEQEGPGFSRQVSHASANSSSSETQDGASSFCAGISNPRCGDHKLVLVMVGLPARGKSYITRHLKRYLTFESFGVQIFNAGDYRRKLLGSGQDASFFDPDNEEGHKLRMQMGNAAREDLLAWLLSSESAHVGILDATNSTAERRASVLQRCMEVDGVRVAFVESVCNDPEVLSRNYEMKLKNADYDGWDEATARQDFIKRAEKYESLYETIEDDEANGRVSYMKILNCGEKMVQRRCEGYLVSKVAEYVLNLHVQPRVIYLTRNGLSVESHLGGDAELTKEGLAFAHRLRDFMHQRVSCTSSHQPDDDSSREGWLLYTSQVKRVHETMRPLFEDANFIADSGMRRVHTSLLNEINAGIYDGYTAAQFQQRAPEEFAARERNKLGYRYPHGESYLDVVQRIRPVAMEIEREKRPVLVIGHHGVLRCILAFFLGTPLKDMPELQVPLHTVLQLTITPHGCDVEHLKLVEDGVSSNGSLGGDSEVSTKTPSTS